MKHPEQLSVRVPNGTKARLRALSGADETLVSTLLRAIDLLEQHTDPIKGLPLERVERRVTNLERRVKNIEYDQAGFDRDILSELMAALDRAWKAKNGLID